MDSIGSFAESLILEDLDNINKGQQSSFGGGGVAAETDMPDISNIDLNSNQVQALVAGQNISEEVMPIQESVQEEQYEVPQQQRSEDPVSVLIEQLSYLVEKAESLVNRLDEITAVGGLGVGAQANLMKSEPFCPPPPPKVMNTVKKLRRYRRR